MKALEYSQHYTYIFQAHMTTNLLVIKIHLAFMVVLVTYKNGRDPFKIQKTLEWSQHSPFYVNGDFSKHSRTANSVFPS